MPNVDLLFLPENGSRSAFKRAVLNMLIGDVRQVIQRSLLEAGFRTVRVSKIIHHDVYEISLLRGLDMVNDSDSQVQKRIRRALRSNRLYKNSRTNLLVISVQRRRILCGFHAAEAERTNALGEMRVQ